MSTSFVTIRMAPMFHATARAYGEMVHRHSQEPGAHNTSAAESRNDVLSHVKGKYGELAVLKWLMSEGVLPSHTPFRNDYRVEVEQDDFVVNGIQVEVKAKLRGERSPFPPQPHYNVNLGKFGLDNLPYVFVEISPRGRFEDGPECLLLGWADAALIRAKGKPMGPGEPSDGNNFPFQRHDWDIPVEALREVAELLALLRAASDKVQFSGAPFDETVGLRNPIF